MDTRSKPSKAWRKKYACKKNKGPHSWVIATVRSWLSYTVKRGEGYAYGMARAYEVPKEAVEVAVASRAEWRCSACSKRDVEFYGKGFISFERKKLDPYRPHKPYLTEV